MSSVPHIVVVQREPSTKAIAFLSLGLILCSIAIFSSGSRIYSWGSHNSFACNLGFNGVPILVLGFLGVGSVFFRSQVVLVLITAIFSFYSLLLGLMWVFTSVLANAYQLRAAKPGYFLDAYNQLGLLESSMCFDGPNTLSDACACIDVVGEETFDYTSFCNPSCVTTSDGFWATFTFLLISFVLTTIISIIGCATGGCACCARVSQRIVTAQPV
eukprot:c53312_g1_i1.p1 GENE.c53312_g1_i1~~c53312_g1_i1.p1  ORF type:complete len:231 (+),score=53.00 c53312_g1_i1:49-693(+)